MYYAVYKNIIAISLFNHEAYLFSNTYDGDHNLDVIENLLNSQISKPFKFEKVGKKSSNLSDSEFIDFVKREKNIATEEMYFN